MSTAGQIRFLTFGDRRIAYALTGDGPPRALTDAISCSASGCKVKYVADGPSIAHVEGHIAFAASP